MDHFLPVSKKWMCLLAILLIALSSCAVFNKNINFEKANKVIEMSMGPCFGSCPIYTITIYDNGWASYRGKLYTDKLGLHIKKIGKARLEEIKRELRLANLWQYSNIYKSQLPDLQSVTINYYEKDRTKSITGKEGRPSSVMKIEDFLAKMANSGGWIEKEKPAYEVPEGAVPNELIVQLKVNVNAEAFVQKYSKQALKIVKRLSPTGDYWLFSFNETTIPPNEMLTFIRRDREVQSAEFNKKLEMRNQ
ncbi:MAG: DUF6438 domain-containing protein [Saprospiraceae bacterium]